MEHEAAEQRRIHCRSYFDDEGAMQIYDLIADADRMVGIENARIQYGSVNAPEFLGKVAKALRLSTELLQGHHSPVMRGRAARLIAEVASRYVEEYGPQR